MSELLCPICYRIHKNLPFRCECGYYEGRTAVKDYNNKENRLFSIYKFSKLIFNKQLDWKQSKYVSQEYYSDGNVYIKEIYDESNAIAYIDFTLPNKKTGVEAGILAFDYHVKSLILNVNILDHEMLDESGVRMLFLGDKVSYASAFINTSLKYIEVSEDNPHYTAKNNVLFDKNMTRLIYYCDLKPDQEYTIPKTVKEVASRAFIGCGGSHRDLKVIHCSKNVIFKDPNCTPSPYDSIKIIYDQD